MNKERDMVSQKIASLLALSCLFFSMESQASPFTQAKSVQDVAKLNQADILRCMELEGIISISRPYIVSMLRVIANDKSVSDEDRETAEDYLSDLEEKSANKGLNSDLSSRIRLVWLKAYNLVCKYAQLTNKDNDKSMKELTNQLQEYKKTFAESTREMPNQKKVKAKNSKKTGKNQGSKTAAVESD